VRSLLERDLAISLVHHDPPRNHVRAQRLLDSLLSRSPNDLSCLLAKAYIYTSSARFSGAYDLFSRVEAETPSDDEKVKFEARAEKAWALANIEERMAEALDELFSVANEMDKDQDTDRTKKAQAWWRYGQCCWSMDSEELFCFRWRLQA
jgi:superkiller protein 3